MEIHIEFCIKWNYGPEFDRVSKEIKELQPDANIEGNKNNPRTGSFEIIIDGKLVYSKFETHAFPSKTEIQELMKWLNLY